MAAEFDIEKVTEAAGQAVKKNPLPWLLGLGAVLIGGMYALGRRTSAAQGDVAITELPQVPADTGISAGGGGADMSQAISDLLDAQTQMFAELRQSQAEQTPLTAEMLRNLTSDIRSGLEESVSKVEQAARASSSSRSSSKQDTTPSYRYAGSEPGAIDAAAKVIELKETYAKEQAAYGKGFNLTERAKELENAANAYRAMGNLDPKKYGAAVTLEQAKKAYQGEKKK